MVYKFCAEVILARNNSGYLRSFVAYKAQELLIIFKKHIHKCIIKEIQIVKMLTQN